MYNILPRDQLKVDAVATAVRGLLDGEATGHDWHHVKRVWETAAVLAYRENADGFVVSLAALLHDVDDPKVTGDQGAEAGLPNARHILAVAGIDAAIVERVCRTIATVGFRKTIEGRPDRTPEADIVSDADLLDAIGAVGIARSFTYGAVRRRPVFDPARLPLAALTSESYADDGTTINHFFEKLLTVKDLMVTEAGRDEAGIRHDTMVAFLSAFFEETRAPREWSERLWAITGKQAPMAVG